MKYDPIDPRLFIENRKRLAAELPEGSIAILHSADIPWRCADGSTKFIQNSDLFYLTGADQEDTMLILDPGAADPADREILFVKETSDLIAIWEGQKLTKETATQVSGIENVQWNDSFEPTVRRLVPQAKQLFLNCNEHARSESTAVTPDDRFRRRIQLLYPEQRCERLAPLLTRLRMVKSDIEIGVLQKACDITADGFRRSLGFIRPGVKEYEVEAEFLHEFARQGSRGFAYEPIIAGGINNCVLHYLDNDQECREGDLLLMDVAAEYANYNADLTRTVPISGKFTERQRAVYDALYRVFRACIDDLIKPGVPIREVFQKQASRLVEEELIGLGLLDADEVAKEHEQEDLPEEKRKYRQWFMHGVSHSLGIDVHDVTAPEATFLENMVITVEPGIYLREEGFGVRLENDIVVREGGNLDLMADIPIEADEIEALMAEGRASS